MTDEQSNARKEESVSANNLDRTAQPPGVGESADREAGLTPDKTKEGANAGPPPEETIEQLKAKVAALADSLLRAKADYQNLLHRSARERSEAAFYANAELMRALLPVLDDFERSLEAARSSKNAASVAEGVRLVYDNLQQSLRSHGLESIEALDKPFDPHVHEAVMQQPSAEHPPGTVKAEVAKGYRLRERVLRPAKVVVSIATEQAADGVQEEDEKLERKGNKRQVQQKG